MSHAFLKKTFNNRIAWKSSPNFGLRKLPIKAIVVHYTQMPHDAALEKLCDPSSQVSAHFLIKEDGFITQLVCTSKRAWHAGVSCLNEITDVNSLSIGIELDYPGPNEHGLFPTYPSLQIEALIKLLDVLTTLHSIAKDSIVGHSDVAPNRKIDPGPSFPWDHLKHHGFSKDVLKNELLVSLQ